jgi:hypothetical protein
MILDARYPDSPSNLKEPQSIKGCPSARLHQMVWRNVCSERILFVLARDESAVGTFSLPDDAVENEDR